MMIRKFNRVVFVVLLCIEKFRLLSGIRFGGGRKKGWQSCLKGLNVYVRNIDAKYLHLVRRLVRRPLEESSI